jgi:hypothetical protein
MAKHQYTITEEERERRRQWALENNKEVIDPKTGRRRFGGPQPNSGRPRKIRAAEIVAEEATKNARQIVAALVDALDPEQPIKVRIEAAQKWLDIENKESALQLKEDKEWANLSEEELAKRITASFARMVEGGDQMPEEIKSLGQILLGSGSEEEEEIILEDD